MKLTVQAILLSLLKQSYKSKEQLVIIYWGVGGGEGVGAVVYHIPEAVINYVE